MYRVLYCNKLIRLFSHLHVALHESSNLEQRRHSNSTRSNGDSQWRLVRLHMQRERNNSELRSSLARNNNLKLRECCLTL